MHKTSEATGFIEHLHDWFYFTSFDAISLGTVPRMSGTGERSEAAWPDRSCFGRSEKLGEASRNSPRGSRDNKPSGEVILDMVKLSYDLANNRI